MILVDTSIWIDHFRKGDSLLRELLEQQGVLVHPFIIGELAMGNFRQRNVILSALGDLPTTMLADDAEVLQYISRQSLAGRGMGYVDAHLLTSVQMTPDALLWTRDKRLAAVAAKLWLSFAAK